MHIVDAFSFLDFPRFFVNLIKIHEYYILLNVPKIVHREKLSHFTGECSIAFNSLNNKIFKTTFNILKILKSMENGTF